MSARKTWIAIAAVLVAGLIASGVWLARKGDRDAPAGTKVAAGGTRDVAAQPAGRRAQVRTARSGTPHDGDAETHAVSALPVRAALAELPMSASVRAVAGLDTNRVGAVGRRTALKELTRELSAEDVAALRLFLRSTLADQPDGIGGEQFFALKNDVLDVLVRQEQFPSGLGIDLAEMFRDTTQDIVWRDYCVQYLADCHARLPAADPAAAAAAVLETASDAASVAAAERDAILDALEDALEERGSTIAGTALIGLEQVSRVDAGLDREAVLRAAAGIALDDAASEASRITALRVAALMGGGDILPAARMLAQVGETDTLRLAAVATLGDVGAAEDLELLQAVSAAADGRMRPVAAGALKRLKDRLARPAAGEGGA